MVQHTFTLLDDHDWLTQKYLTEGLSLGRIAELVGCRSHRTVRLALDDHRIPVRRMGPPRKLADVPTGSIRRALQRGAVAAVARELGVSTGTLRSEARSRGIDLVGAARARRQAATGPNPAWPPLLRDRAELEAAYRERPSASAIARMVGCHRTTVTAALDVHGIERRLYGRGQRIRRSPSRK